jgi:deazaflavin-dependent oxidoreductase (nitroreductase family)
MPRALRPLLKATSGVGSLMMRSGMKVQGRPLLRLTTVGARSGKRRTTVLAWFSDETDDDAWLVVASNAGSPRHPAWAHNLARSPAEAWVDVGEEREVPVEADLLTGAERATNWYQVVELAPGYGRYEEKTDRLIPIFRLARRT